MLGVILRLGIPSAFCATILYSQEIINLYFAGHMNDETKLAAIGLGNMIQNCLIISLMVSLNSAVETLVSQASGGGNPEFT
jgi:Na+-driven multidrug efflux pump